MSKEEREINQELTFVTNKVVKRLIEWKTRREKWKKRKFICDILAMALMGYVIVKIYFQLNTVNDIDGLYATLFSPGVESALTILIPIIIVWKFSNWKYKEVDGDYEVLRKEVIDRADELWFQFPEDWSNRQEVLQYIDKEYGVNLFYKKK